MIYEIKNSIKNIFDKVIKEEYGVEFDLVIERPKEFELGDIAIPVFKLAKDAKAAPPEIAKNLASKIDDEMFEKLDVVGGYINIHLNRSIFTKATITKIMSEGSEYGTDKSLNDKTVIVEYSSPNIAKPFHIGHIRSTVIGAVLYRTYKHRGYNTVGINHLGDYGTQFGKLIVAIRKWGDMDKIAADPIPSLLEIYIKFHDEIENDPSLEEEARRQFMLLENGDEEAYKLWKWIREISLSEFSRVYDMLNIKFDSLAGEFFYSDKMPAVIEELKQKEVLVKDDGAGIVRLEEYGMPNALVTKRDGSSIYITRDIAAAIYRKDTYDFYKNIYVVGHEQELHFKQWKKIVELMGYEWANDCEHVQFGLVSLEEGRLATRKGRVLFLEDVLNKAIEKSGEILDVKSPNIENKAELQRQIGIGAMIFQEIFINRKKDYVFSWDKTLNFEGETGPYLQYTAVRIKSILNSAKDLGIDPSNVDYSNVNLEAWYLVSKIIDFEEVIVNTLDKNDPSQLAKYIMDISQAFNKFYANHKIFTDDEKNTEFNVIICMGVYKIMQNVLGIIGIEIPERM